MVIINIYAVINNHFLQLKIIKKIIIIFYNIFLINAVF